jgi:hypothetical protein
VSGGEAEQSFANEPTLFINLSSNSSKLTLEQKACAEMADPKIDEARRSAVVDDDEPDEWFVWCPTPHQNLSS